MTYNMTQLAASDSIYKLVLFSNDITTGALVAMFILALFFILLMSLKKYEFDSALLVSSFICFVISVFMMYAELLALMWVLAYLIVAAFAGFIMFITK